MSKVNEELVRRIDNLSKLKAAAQSKEQVYLTQKAKVEEEIKSLGYDPSTLNDSIQELSNKIVAFEEQALPVIEAIEQELAKANSETHATEQFKGF